IKDALEEESKKKPEIEIRAPVTPPKEAKESAPKQVASTEIKPVEVEEIELPKLDEQLVDSKYAVRDLANNKGWVRVEINETISQIATWLGVATDKLREWNGIEARGQVRLGQRLLIKFEKKTPQEFLTERSDYHKQIKEDFFSRYEVDSFTDYQVQLGENL